MCHSKRALRFLICCILAPGMAIATTANAARGDAPAYLVEQARQYVAAEATIPGDNLLVVYQNNYRLSLTEQDYVLFKIVDRTTGERYMVGIDHSGVVLDHERLQAIEKQKYRERYGKLHPRLHDRLAQSAADDQLPVSIWLRTGSELRSERPTPDAAKQMSRSDIAAFKRAAAERSREFHSAVRRPLNEWLDARGYSGKGSDSAPIVFTKVPAQTIHELARLDYVVAIDLVVVGGPDGVESRLGGGPEADSAHRTEKADIVEDRGITGQGIVLGVVEKDAVSGANPYLNNTDHAVTYYRPPTIDSHPTFVAGFMASTHDTSRGVAPYIDEIASANSGAWTLTAMQPAVHWARETRGATALNNSYYLGTTGALTMSDRWADHLVRSHNSAFVVAAGNQHDTNPNYLVRSPGLAYNVITVGAIDHLGTGSWDDDRMWNDTGYVAPQLRWKPDVVACGCKNSVPDIDHRLTGTTTAWPWIGTVDCGTSFAAPAVTGMAATLQQREPFLAFWPEAVKAIVIASALHDIEGDQARSDRDGAGHIDMAAGDLIAAERWWTAQEIDEYSFDGRWMTIPIGKLYAGERFRAALTYDSNPDSDDYFVVPPFPPGSALEGDLDLYLYDSNGTDVAFGGGIDSWEIIDHTVSATDEYELRIVNYGYIDGRWTYMAVAWFKGHNVLNSAIQIGDPLTSAGDAYRVDTSSTAEWWAIGLKPQEAGYDLLLYDESVYGNPAEYDFLVHSVFPEGDVDVVLIDRHHAPAKSYYPEVRHGVSGGTGYYRIQSAVHGGLLTPGVRSFTTSPLFVVMVFDVPMSAGVPTYFALRGEEWRPIDLGMLLMDSDPGDSSTFYQHRGDAVAQADLAGVNEAFNYSATDSDTMALVVYNNYMRDPTSWDLYVDVTAPTGETVQVNGGAPTTASPLVTLNLSASDPQTGVGEMRLSNDGVSWTPWRAYAPAVAWTLTPGDGTKHVFVQFRNNAGQPGPSTSVTIVLDQDADNDSAPNVEDNCNQVFNPAQRDTDGDSIGNRCDPDIAVPNDCVVNFADLNVMKMAFFATRGSPNWNPDADFNGDDVVNFADLLMMKTTFFGLPGPSGRHNACAPDLTVQLVNAPTTVGCPGGQGTCLHTVDFVIDEMNGVGTLETFWVQVFTDSGLFDALPIPGIMAGAGVPLSVTLGPGDNCYDPDCAVTVEVDYTHVLTEFDEGNNIDSRLDTS